MNDLRKFTTGSFKGGSRLKNIQQLSIFSIFNISCFLFLLIAPSVDSLAIHNGVVGDPQVQCSEDSVTFSIRSQGRFSGNIFIKGKYNVPQCRQEYFSNSFNGASFTVRIGECGMRRIRQLQPHGMNYVLVFVVNFHSQFITKVDRAYNVRCFYAQVDKTVTSQLEVSMIQTTELRVATMVMPNCVYTLRSGALNGPVIRFAKVGDQLIHRWECDNPAFGMLVKNCVVNDGQGSSVRVLDSRGCPVFTPVIQGTLNYDANLNLAYVEVWAYKFPDRSNLFFQCQIQICNKRENECQGITPPSCPLVSGGTSQVVIPSGQGTFIPRGQGSFLPGSNFLPGSFGPDQTNYVAGTRTSFPGYPVEGPYNGVYSVVQTVPGGLPIVNQPFGVNSIGTNRINYAKERKEGAAEEGQDGLDQNSETFRSLELQNELRRQQVDPQTVETNHRPIPPQFQAGGSFRAHSDLLPPVDSRDETGGEAEDDILQRFAHASIEQQSAVASENQGFASSSTANRESNIPGPLRETHRSAGVSQIANEWATSQQETIRNSQTSQQNDRSSFRTTNVDGVRHIRFPTIGDNTDFGGTHLKINLTRLDDAEEIQPPTLSTTKTRRDLGSNGVAAGNNRSQNIRRRRPIPPTNGASLDMSEAMMKNDAESNADSMTFDVAAEEVFIVDVPDEPGTEGGESESVNALFNASSMGAGTVCLNPSAMGLILACFVILILVIVILLVHICLRSRRGGRGNDNCSSSSSANIAPDEYPSKQNHQLKHCEDSYLKRFGGGSSNPFRRWTNRICTK